jgi:hypothetical protein
VEVTWNTVVPDDCSHWEVTRVDHKLQPLDAVYVVLLKDMEDDDNQWLLSGVNIITKAIGIWDSYALLSLAPTNSDVEIMEESTFWVNINLLDLSAFFEWDPFIPFHDALPKDDESSDNVDQLDEEDSFIPSYV